MPSIRVYFLPSGQAATVPVGSTVLEAMRTTSLVPHAPCGGTGRCGQCNVLAENIPGALTPTTALEEERLSAADRASGVRLACQARLLRPLTITVPETCAPAGLRLQVEGSGVPGTDSGDAPFRMLLIRGGMEEDVEHLLMRATQPDPAAPENNPLWEERPSFRVGLHGGTAVWALPASEPVLGLAVDLGTTKIAAYLLDLETGKPLASAGKPNPQASWGEDVMSRIAAAMQDGRTASAMTEAVREAVNALGEELCTAASGEGIPCAPRHIVESVVVANTVMQHLFLGQDVSGLGHAPFTMADTRAVDGPARAAGLRLNPRARLFMPPPVAGFVGSDHLAMLVGADLADAEGIRLAIDIGTNTEVSLIRPEGILICSTASGPAFEGAHISSGMRAGEGAVDTVAIRSGELACHAIGDGQPIGLCGSGALDAVACLRKLGALSRQGTFVPSHPLVRKGRSEALLCPASATRNNRDLTLSRADVGEIQLAKAAIRSGVELLLKQAGLNAADLDGVTIAGAFGTYLNLENALSIGMFPPLPASRYRQTGNAAGMGAIRMLLSAKARQEAQALHDRMRHCELATLPAFASVYTRSMLLE